MTDQDFEILKPRIMTAIELSGRELSGRSAPLFVTCRTQDGQTQRIILKLKEPMVPDQHPWRTCLSRELIGAMLARRLGLAVPDYAIVNVGSVFARAVSRTAEAERVRRSIGLNFGSVVIEPVLPDISAMQEWEPWEDTLSFDALGYNADRKPRNPNVLWNGTTLYLIDQGLLAPTWTASVDGLTGTTLYGNVNIHTHAGFERLRNTGATFEELKKRWEHLVTSGFLDWVMTQVPSEWVSSQELDECLAFLNARSSIAEEQSRQLQDETR